MFDKFMRRSAAAVVVALAGIAPAQATSYTITALNRPGYDVTSLWGINNSGQMVGYNAGGSLEFDQAFSYDGATFTSLTGPAGAIASNAVGISDGGVVVGSYATSFSLEADGSKVLDPGHGFIYASGNYTTFDVAGGVNTQLRGISPDGRHLSGFYSDAGTGFRVGFVYDRVGDTLNIVGKANSYFTIMQGINSSYVAVGSDLLTGPPTQRPGVIYDITMATRTDVFLPGAFRIAFRDIDDAGNLAGWFVDADGATHGFAGSVGSYDQIDFAGAVSTFLEGSNNAGVLVGHFDTRTQSQLGFIARPVPEPATLALLVGGLGLMAWRRGHRAGRSG